jgi:NADH:ubiquinone oxidoreductase subunit E
MNKINLNINELDKDKLSQLDSYVDTLIDPAGNLINVLHRAQNIFGYIPFNLQLYISRKLDINAAKVNGVVTFYSYFTEKKTGEHVISVCMGTACYVKGSEKVLNKVLEVLDVKKTEVTKDGIFSVRDVRCIGACGLAPVLTVGEKVFGHVSEDMVEEILDRYRGDINGN